VAAFPGPRRLLGSRRHVLRPAFPGCRTRLTCQGWFHGGSMPFPSKCREGCA
jgi:hypothetical protein